MGRRVLAVVILLVTLALAFAAFNRHHFWRYSVCGSGLYGIKLLAVYMFFILLLFLAFWLLIIPEEKTRKCPACKSSIDEGWRVCPYCGWNLERTDG